jgi:16S rRNA processing protein RimM
MNTNAYFLIGRIPKTLSYKGDVLIVFNKGLPIDYETQEYFFLNTSYGLVPFHVESFEMNNRDGAIVRFTDAADEEKAKELVGMEVYLPDELLSGIPEEDYTAAMLIGYKVSDKDTGKLGTVKGVMELPEQSLLEIQDGKKEFLIPLVREMILKFDHRKKTILFDLPEGLVALND